MLPLMQIMRRPTERQKKFVEGKLAGKSSYRAALDAGYPHGTAKDANEKIMEAAGTTEYTNAIGAALATMGVDAKYLAERLLEGTKATKKVGRYADIETEDYPTRLDYAKYAAELQDLGPTKKVDVTSGGEPISFHWETEAEEEKKETE